MSTEPESVQPADTDLEDDKVDDAGVEPVIEHADAAIGIDPEHVGGPAFWIGLVVGWVVIIGGIRVGLHDREVKPAPLLQWLGGGLILHDAVWLPLLALVGGLGTMVIRRRVPPFVAWAVMTSAVLTLIAWPFLRGYGRRADVPSALQRNYARGLLAYIGITWLIALFALAIDVQHRRRRGGPLMLGVFGGSGFYEFLDDVEHVAVDTPYGAPAAPVSIGTVAGRRVAFMARHGRTHDFVAHRVPYRANVWAMHSIGVTSVIAPCSVGSLQADIHPGQLVVVDQLVDRTWGRPDTFHDQGPVLHQTFADPYDVRIGHTLVEACRTVDADVVDGGTMVVINGPRFSTRAESRWFREMGWHVVNMTGYPESVLAAEIGIRYAAIALVTDFDAGVDGHPPVAMNDVFATMHANVSRVSDVIARAIADSYDAMVDAARPAGT